MSLPIRVARGIAGILAETTAGTFNEPGNTNCFHAINLNYAPTQSKFARKDTRSHFGTIDDIPGAGEGDISWEIPLIGGLVGGVPTPGIVPYWDACMLSTGHQRGILPNVTASGWVTATQYAVGAIVNGAVNTYICTVAIASSSASPLGTTTSSDGGAAGMWTYVCAKNISNYVVGTAYPVGSVVKGASNVYVLTAPFTGTGLSVTTPTGILATFADNGGNWAYMYGTVPVWTASAFTAGAVVVVAPSGANANSGAYTCVLTGTATGGNAPTSTTPGLVQTTADGLQWLYLGPSYGAVHYKPTTQFDGTVVISKGMGWLQPAEGYTTTINEDFGSTASPRYAITGSQGEFSFTSKQGEPLLATFKYHGGYFAVADDTTPVVTDIGVVPPTLLGAGINFFGQTLPVDGFNFSKGNGLSKRQDVNAASGYRGAWITSHNPTVKIAPEMQTVATFNVFSNWRAGSTGAVNLGPVGSTPGNKVGFSAIRAQIEALTLADREGARVSDVTLSVTTAMAAVSGDDYIVYVV